MKTETLLAAIAAAGFAFLLLKSRKRYRECKAELDFRLGRKG